MKLPPKILCKTAKTLRIITKLFHMFSKHYETIILHKFGFVNHFLNSASDFCNIGVIKNNGFDLFLHQFYVESVQYSKFKVE